MSQSVIKVKVGLELLKRKIATTFSLVSASIVNMAKDYFEQKVITREWVNCDQKWVLGMWNVAVKSDRRTHGQIQLKIQMPVISMVETNNFKRKKQNIRK